jgi:hypothetical protein
VKRWEQVAAYVRTRTVDEVLDMVKHGLKAGKFAPKQDTFNVVKKRQVRAACACISLERCREYPTCFPGAEALGKEVILGHSG